MYGILKITFFFCRKLHVNHFSFFLQNTVGMFKPEYATYEQQDSHEFLTFLMDWLHNDLNKV